MNFFKELEKKSWSHYNLKVVSLKDAKEVFKCEWRVFWNKRKKEIEKELLDKKKRLRKANQLDIEYAKAWYDGIVHNLELELSWIEKQRTDTGTGYVRDRKRSINNTKKGKK